MTRRAPAPQPSTLPISSLLTAALLAKVADAVHQVTVEWAILAAILGQREEPHPGDDGAREAPEASVRRSLGEAGLVYMWNRWQDPDTGTFISEDPERVGGNWYTYAYSSPLNYVDPTGLDPNGADAGEGLGGHVYGNPGEDGNGFGAHTGAMPAPLTPQTISFSTIGNMDVETHTYFKNGAYYGYSVMHPQFTSPPPSPEPTPPPAAPTPSPTPTPTPTPQGKAMGDNPPPTPTPTPKPPTPEHTFFLGYDPDDPSVPTTIFRYTKGGHWEKGTFPSWENLTDQVIGGDKKKQDGLRFHKPGHQALDLGFNKSRRVLRRGNIVFLEFIYPMAFDDVTGKGGYEITGMEPDPNGSADFDKAYPGLSDAWSGYQAEVDEN